MDDEFFRFIWDVMSEKIANKIMDRVDIIVREKIQHLEESTASEKPIRGQRALCHLYGMSSATLNRMIQEGKIPYRKIGNRFLFYRSEVDEALKNKLTD